MELARSIQNSALCFPPVEAPTARTHFIASSSLIPPRARVSIPVEKAIPTMSDILEASKRQKLDLQLQRLGPFFRITAKSLESGTELGKAEGFIRLWFGGKILHLDSIRLRRETLGMEKSIFGIGLFIGAVAIRLGYDCGCKKAELLAINDTDLYHRKLVRFYTRIGFKTVYEVSGSSFGDLAHMLVWGGVGTRMDADIEDLMIKWCSRFTPQEKKS
ncbi:OLC1v1002905C1 [Oldenlandia corymbosa var. corymbosa]|uniref:OLC1v1002905C1 n=1 Tax=Oldenlandia corymbosa var. corymbosa TaxID=529605 RepID=A0AAV1D8U4_OLDCO|nr:OLC1v1002905C1 [Oldenlandia corymbosa var. corymbosa]